MPKRTSAAPSAAEPGEPQCIAPGAVAANSVRSQLEKILASALFRRSPQLSRFLSYVVNETLDHDGEGLKEYEIGRQVFQKPDSFDVRLDPIVRVEARRLRGRLTEYYAGEGADDAVLIDLGKRGYKAQFSVRAEGEASGPATAEMPAVDRDTAIAVLPFIDMTEEGDQGYFCDGLTEELIHALTRIPGLQVASRSSAFQFKGGGQDVRKVGADLGVAVVMEGSLRKHGKRMRVTAQLTSADSGFHLWSETYDTELEDLFEIQERIATSIVETVRQQRRAPVAGLLRRRQTEHAAAYRAFLRGLHLQRSWNGGELLESEKALTAAVEADPDYAPAFAALAQTRVKLLWGETRAPAEGWPQVKAAAERALALDPASAVALSAMGCARAAGDWNWPETEKCFEAARASGDSEATVLREWASRCLIPLKRFDEALEAATAAAELTPGTIETWHDLGWVRFFRREFAESADQFLAVLNDKADHVPSLLGLARSYLGLGETGKALATAELAAGIESTPLVLGVLLSCEAAAGRAQAAAATFDRLLAIREQAYVSPRLIAAAELALGRKESAVTRLEQALEDRSVRLIELDVDPAWDALRSKAVFDRFRIAVCLQAPAESKR